MDRLRLIGAAVLASAGAARAQDAVRPQPGIQDNSFLIEEAYNQDRGVVQHISSFQRSAGSWAYSFTQEWPVPGIRHQLSYSIPVLHDATGGTGVGDVALNYRYQLIGSGSTRLAVAPRLTVIVPTGSAAAGRGAGGVAVQTMLPVSTVLSPAFVAHWNVGATITPAAHGPAGSRARVTALNAGASAVWLARSWLNLLVEGVVARAQVVDGPALTHPQTSCFISPGVRAARNFASGLQVVPGVAYEIGLGPSSHERYIFLYLSFEHPFRH